MKRYRHYTKGIAIVLSCFGSIIEQRRYEALKEIVQERFQGCDVFLAFNSRMVLKHLQKKGQEYKNLPQILVDVDMLGYKFIAVISVNLFPTDEHEAARKVVEGFRVFSMANIGFSDAILTKTKTTGAVLKSLNNEISKDDRANLYIIHGTPRLDTKGIESINYTSRYLEFINDRNFTCSLEGAFAYSDIKDNLISKIKDRGYKSVQIIPLLLVSGNHYIKDMNEIKDDLSLDFDSSLAEGFSDENFNLLSFKPVVDTILQNAKETLLKMGLDVE